MLGSGRESKAMVSSRKGLRHRSGKVQGAPHRLGHGMGMDGHEWPYLVRGNGTRLVAGMTTSNEPGIYLRGEFGIRLEDDMHVLEDGAELFTPRSRSLEEPFEPA